MSSSEPDEAAALRDQLGQAIIRALAVDGPMLKGDIIARTGASNTSVIARLRHLEQVGLVTADPPPGQRWGRRVVYEVDKPAVTAATDALRDYLLGDD